MTGVPLRPRPSKGSVRLSNIVRRTPSSSEVWVGSGREPGRSWQAAASVLPGRSTHIAWDQYRIGGREGVDREQSERWRAIDEDRVVSVSDDLYRACESAFAGFDRGKLHLSARKRDGRWDHIQSIWAGNDQPLQGEVVDDRVMDRALQRRPIQAEPTRGIALGVEVDDEDAVSSDGAIGRRLTTVVVLPTPPFWFAQATVCATQRPAWLGLTVIDSTIGARFTSVRAVRPKRGTRPCTATQPALTRRSRAFHVKHR